MSLTDTCKEFVRLRYYLKHSIEEIGQIMGFANYQTAKNKHFRCIDSLRDWLAAHPKFREYLREIRE